MSGQLFLMRNMTGGKSSMKVPLSIWRGLMQRSLPLYESDVLPIDG